MFLWWKIDFRDLYVIFNHKTITFDSWRKSGNKMPVSATLHSENISMLLKINSFLLMPRRTFWAIDSLCDSWGSVMGRDWMNLDQLAKLTFHSRYAYTPFGSAPVPILSSWKVIAIFVMRSHHHVIICWHLCDSRFGQVIWRHTSHAHTVTPHTSEST